MFAVGANCGQACYVCTEHFDIRLSQTVEHRRVGVTVEVVRSDGDDGECGVKRSEEAGIGGGFAAMMSDLQDIDTRHARFAEQAVLGGALGVARKQEAMETEAEKEDKGIVVFWRGCGNVIGSGRKHLDGRLAEGKQFSRVQASHGRVRFAGRRGNGLPTYRWRIRSGPDFARAEVTHESGEAAYVIVMGMGACHDVYPVNPRRHR